MNTYESAALGVQKLERETLYNPCFAGGRVVAMLFTGQVNVDVL